MTILLPAGRPLTAQSHAHVRFRRAVQSGSVTLALTAAAELGALDLEDAFALTLLLCSREPARYGRAAAKWHAADGLPLTGRQHIAIGELAPRRD